MLSGKYTIDRFEGNLAVLLFRKNETIEVTIQKGQLPVEAKIGDIVGIKIQPDGSLMKVEILEEETEKTKEVAKRLLKEILNSTKPST
ncbi:MAG TPA: DUF3006 domain-containing protein [Pseudoneobacillus sp.]|jgi:hypothetical protein|nr:DUF3006 domain-containing protein [Pseudoneobacillus sp.]